MSTQQYPRYCPLLLPFPAAQEGSPRRHRRSGLCPGDGLRDVLFPAGHGPDDRGGQLGEGSVENEQLTFGPYPDARRLKELENEGYDSVITLLNPSIPFESVLLDQELEQGEEAGIEVYSYPMLPWVSENEEALAAIDQLVGDNEGRYYIHCYLGKHRVELVRRALTEATEDTITAEEEPLKSSLERGRLSAFDEERIVLGPYPTDEEWIDAVLRRNIEEIVSTLDPANLEDVPRIEQERQIAEENGLIFTQRPLDAESPDPAAVQEVADYLWSLNHKVYVHNFNVSERFRALDSVLQEEEGHPRRHRLHDGPRETGRLRSYPEPAPGGRRLFGGSEVRALPTPAEHCRTRSLRRYRKFSATSGGTVTRDGAPGFRSRHEDREEALSCCRTTCSTPRKRP